MRAASRVASGYERVHPTAGERQAGSWWNSVVLYRVNSTIDSVVTGHSLTTSASVRRRVEKHSEAEAPRFPASRIGHWPNFSPRHKMIRGKIVVPLAIQPS